IGTLAIGQSHPPSILSLLLVSHNFSMTSIVELFPKTRRLMYDLQTQMQYVERGHASPDDVSVGLEGFTQQIRMLEGLVNQERPTQRENWKKKLRELGKERDFLEEQLSRHNQGRHRANREAREREELMARRNAAMPSSVTDAYAEEGASLQRSNRMVGDYLYQGSAALTSLVDQRQRLKGVQRKVLDITNIMGISNRILRVAERRSKMDKLLVYGGMVLTMIMLW
ncbi:unnamed protein product, partial [Chrysoparadoxa australica]